MAWWNRYTEEEVPVITGHVQITVYTDKDCYKKCKECSEKCPQVINPEDKNEEEKKD